MKFLTIQAWRGGTGYEKTLVFRLDESFRAQAKVWKRLWTALMEVDKNAISITTYTELGLVGPHRGPAPEVEVLTSISQKLVEAPPLVVRIYRCGVSFSWDKDLHTSTIPWKCLLG